jgi:DNA-binding MarR family transcriptional regulator
MEIVNDARIRLDDMLCFPLYATSRAVTRAYGTLLDGLGLTYPQYLVMLALWESAPMSVSALGTRLRLDSGTLSPLVKRLEAAGRVHRERDPDDERRVLVDLTDAGRALEEPASTIPAQLWGAMGLTSADALALRHQLDQLLANLSSAEL